MYGAAMTLADVGRCFQDDMRVDELTCRNGAKRIASTSKRFVAALDRGALLPSEVMSHVADGTAQYGEVQLRLVDLVVHGFGWDVADASEWVWKLGLDDWGSVRLKDLDCEMAWSISSAFAEYEAWLAVDQDQTVADEGRDR